MAVAFGMAATVSAQGIVPVDDDNVTQTRRTVNKPCVLSIGPKVGINFALAEDPDGMDLDMSGGAGFNGGAAINLRFGRPAGRPLGTERFGVQLEAQFGSRSLKNDVKDISMTGFEIPVLFQWYFVPNFAIEVGPTFAGTFSASPKEFKVDNTIFQMDKIKSYDVMLSIGVNCKLKKGFTADLRYNLGNSDLAGNFQTKVSTISLGIGWLFNVIK